MIERRLPGEITTLETRAEANEQVDRAKRYKQIIEILEKNPEGMTAKQIAAKMCMRGYIPTSERNFAAPRLTELGKRGIVEPLGKTICRYTGKRVTVWGLCKNAEREG